jgi:hypothetical protein
VLYTIHNTEAKKSGNLKKRASHREIESKGFSRGKLSKENKMWSRGNKLCKSLEVSEQVPLQ